MRVAELWRYPVKSLAGERLERVAIDTDGISGDRSLHVVDAEDELVTARTRPQLLSMSAEFNGGAVLVDGEPWNSDRVGERIEAIAGSNARLVESAGGHRHDDTPLLAATDGAVEWIGADRRRFRPNIYIEGVEGLAEREWVGRTVAIGSATIAVERICKRCAVPTLDPDTQVQDVSVLKRIKSELDGRFALNCTVVEPGKAAVGDPVHLN